MYRRILYATDGSPTAEAALDHAIDLATTYDAALEVVSVVDLDALPVDVRVVDAETRFEEASRRHVDEAVERARDGGVESAAGTVRRGDAHRQIVAHAEESDADLIVVGTHGRRGVDRYLLGSVAERVVRHADVPVLTVRNGRRTDRGAGSARGDEGEEADGSDFGED